MRIELDHFIVPTRNKSASAKLLGDLLGVPWGEAEIGPFFAVYLNDGLTLDFIDTDEQFPVHHYCFRVGQDEFESMLARIKAAGIAFRSSVRGPIDRRISTQFGGRGLYWNEPDGHQWEILTVSYARKTR